jgi:AhpD family alkylhydroperoxidase
MKLDNQVLALIAVGASVTANCQPCLEYNVGTALKCGAAAQQIAQAIEIGRRVRRGAANKMDRFAASQSYAAPAAANTPVDGCGCSS